MSSLGYADLASRLLARAGRVPGPPPSPDARARAIAVVEHAILERARRRRRTRRTFGLMAAAAVAVATLGSYRYASRHGVPFLHAPAPTAMTTTAPHDVRIVAHRVTGDANVVVSGAPVPLDDGSTLGTGNRVVTRPNGRALLAFSTGTSVLLEEKADMVIDGDTMARVLRLDSGSMDLHVAKLGPDERFVVRTPDSEVEVRGTAFRVSVAPSDPSCGGGTTTRVAVSEGTVVVRQGGAESRVSAGDSWPAGCTTDASPAQGASSARPGASARAPSGPQSAASKLTEQNDMFAEAITAKRRGDAQGAIAAFDRYLAKYPNSHLAESASVERMRLLRVNDPGRAVGAARQYVARYPTGFAHTEAEAIVEASP